MLIKVDQKDITLSRLCYYICIYIHIYIHIYIYIYIFTYVYFIHGFLCHHRTMIYADFRYGCLSHHRTRQLSRTPSMTTRRSPRQDRTPFTTTTRKPFRTVGRFQCSFVLGNVCLRLSLYLIASIDILSFGSFCEQGLT